MLNKKAFTLVELIVVITILAILWTIAFISLQWYTRDARDAKRVSEIWNIAKSLEAKLMSDWMIPVPDEKVEIKVNGATVYYQWIAWKDVLNKLNIWQEAKDPLDWVWYTYTITNNLRRYQVFWYLEKWKTWYTKWHRLWVIVDPENWNPIHFKKSWVDLKQTSDNFIVYVDNTSSWKIEWNWEEILKNIWKFIVWNYYNTCKQILENNNYIQWIDWKYIIKTKAKTNLEVYCDMTNDWGGWMRYVNIKWNYSYSDALDCFNWKIINNELFECFNPNRYDIWASEIRIKIWWSDYYNKTISPVPSFSTITNTTNKIYYCKWHSNYFTLMKRYSDWVTSLWLWLSFCSYSRQVWWKNQDQGKTYMNYAYWNYWPAPWNRETSAKQSELFIR